MLVRTAARNVYHTPSVRRALGSKQKQQACPGLAGKRRCADRKPRQDRMPSPTGQFLLLSLLIFFKCYLFGSSLLQGLFSSYGKQMLYHRATGEAREGGEVGTTSMGR